MSLGAHWGSLIARSSGSGRGQGRKLGLAPGTAAPPPGLELELQGAIYIYNSL
jgi:hypothetical protein